MQPVKQLWVRYTTGGADGKVAFGSLQGELAIVVGQTASGVSEAAALDHVFGYTCVNDSTEAAIMDRDPSFTQRVRAKGRDGFCPQGPAIATGQDVATLVVKTVLNGELGQNFPVSDMNFTVAQLVSLISADMTLQPGAVILCGTSVGVGSMQPGSEVPVQTEGIGRLCNRCGARPPQEIP